MTADKIFLQDIAEGIAARNGITKKEAEVFVRHLFDIVEEFLLSEQLVKIKGLGTFKLVTVDSRESINVNTGERFTINRHAKVSFVPDKSLSDYLNKPFADFEAVLLNENTQTEDMERIYEPVEPVIEPPSTDETPIEAKEEPMPRTPEPEPAPIVERPVIKPEPEAEEAVEVTAEPTPMVAPEAQETEVVPEPEKEKKDSESMHMQEESPAAAKPSKTSATPIQPVAVSKKCFMYMLIMLNIILLLWWLSFSCIDMEALTSAPPSPAEQPIASTQIVADTDTTRMDSLPAEEPKEVTKATETNIEELIAAHPQIEKGAYWIVGTRTVHVLEKGEDLSKLALKYYGDNRLISYIIRYNNFTPAQASKLFVGAEILIPELKPRQ